jgi:membrane protein DedA with SNARE-associated domain
MSNVVEHLLDVPPALAYLLIAVLVFGEAAIFVGFVLPGETAVILGGVLAASERISLWLLLVLVPLAAIIGDTVGYEVGHRLGPRVLAWKLLRRHRHRLDSTRAFLRHRGGWAVFLGRFTAFMRAVMPGLAGLSRMHYPRFLAYNAAGGIVWGVGVALLGFFAGNSYERVERLVGRGSAIALVVVVLAALALWHVRRRARDRESEADATGGLAGDLDG